MNESIKNALENSKKTEINVGTINEYIELIRKNITEEYESMDGTVSIEEIIEDFKREHKSDIEKIQGMEDISGKVDCPVEYGKIVTYTALKKLLQMSKSDKSKFEKLLAKAKKQEAEMNTGDRLTHSFEPDEEIENYLVYIIKEIKSNYKAMYSRMSPAERSNMKPIKITNKDILDLIIRNKKYFETEIRETCIENIVTSTAYLSKIGVLESRLQEVNKELSSLYPDLEIEMRNPLGRKLDEKGNIIEGAQGGIDYIEDIGYQDSLDIEALKEASPETLIIMEKFYENLYTEVIDNVNEAFDMIEVLGLWTNDPKNPIKDIDEEKLIGIERNNIFLDALNNLICNKNVKIGGAANNSAYRKFIKELGIDKYCDNTMKGAAELRSEKTDKIASLIRRDVLNFLLFIKHLRSEAISVRKWGSIDYTRNDCYKSSNPEKDEKEENTIMTIGIDSKELRWPVMFGVPKQYLREFFKEDDVEKMFQPMDRKKEFEGHMDRFIGLNQLCIAQNPFFMKKTGADGIKDWVKNMIKNAQPKTSEHPVNHEDDDER